MKKTIKFTIRLEKSTVKDLESFAKVMRLSTKTAALRYFIHYGFSHHGNWREK